VKALAFLAEKPSIAQKFDDLEGAEWIGFINSEAKKSDITLAAPAAQFLGTVYQGNSWALITEIQKLGAWRTGSNAKAITKADLDEFDFEVAPNYWGLLNGLKSFDGKARLSALEQMLALNDPPPKIFNILAAQAGERIPRMAEYDLAIKSGKLEYEEALLDLVLG
jgi:DNA polymerase III delta subunit